MAKTKLFGKYRGSVLNNIDPMQTGRLQVAVPDVASVTPTTWAMPCLPFTGIQNGMYVLPTIGSAVWVEFERGDSAHPIWVGGFWRSAAEVPAPALATPPTPQSIVLQTAGQNTLTISDMPGPTQGILLKTTSGAMISISDVGITLSNGKGATIVMAGPTITMNQGALQVI